MKPLKIHNMFSRVFFISASGRCSGRYARYFKGSIPLAFPVSIMKDTIILASAPSGVSLNRQFFRPTTRGRRLFSLMLNRSVSSSKIPPLPYFRITPQLSFSSNFSGHIVSQNVSYYACSSVRFRSPHCFI